MKTCMHCECVPCKACDGSGFYYVSMSGRFLGIHRMDDMAEQEICDDCRGRGLIEVCASCSERVEDDDGY